ncbi:MAG TPA: hypothetical protein VJL33_02110 [Candidatus Bathyarchaeia archaeon]|nr:hypothetical protein [Candidatus Bathyarchaeia archaeon]
MAEKRQQAVFDVILLEAIDEALLSLGENVKLAVYSHLEFSFNIERREIPERIAEFSDALDRIFSLGARHLEVLFMRNLHLKIKLFCEWPTWCKWVISDVTFIEYVRLMKKKFVDAEAGELEVEVITEAGEEQEQYS